jgi:peroxiredoxin
MIELGQLEAHQADFASRNTRIIAASADGRQDSAKTALDFPHLLVLSDPDARLVAAAGVLHAKAGPHGEDIAAPTTVLIDREGRVRWVFRPDRIITRLSPTEVLAAVDQHLAAR